MSFRAKSRNLLFPLAMSAAALHASGAQGTDSLPAFERPNGALLRPGTLTYQLTLQKPDGKVTPLGTRTVTVSEASPGGIPSWQIVEARVGTVVPTLDT